MPSGEADACPEAESRNACDRSMDGCANGTVVAMRGHQAASGKETICLDCRGEILSEIGLWSAPFWFPVAMVGK